MKIYPIVIFAGMTIHGNLLKATNEVVNLNKKPSNKAASTQQQGPENALEQANKLVEGVISVLPGETEAGIRKYLTVLGIKQYGREGYVGDANKGLNAFFANTLDKNSCFSKIVSSFYNDIDELDKKHPREKVAGLFEEVGKGPNSHLKEGWIWDLALKRSGNNPNLAMALIGACGHDDVFQGPYPGFVPISKEDQSFYSKNIHSDLTVLSQLSLYSKTEYEENGKQSLFKEIKALKESLKDGYQRGFLSCPSVVSNMFVPGGLGPNLDTAKLLQILKNINNTSQNYLRGGLFEEQKIGYQMPAGKYYHVYGAAFMTCQLIQGGVSKPLAVFLEKQASRMYRSIRFCDRLKWNPGFTSLDAFKLDKKRGQKFSDWYKARCPDCDAEALEVEAAMLEIYKKWYLGYNKFSIKNLPCTDLHLPKYRLLPDKIVCGKDVDKNICEKAKKQIIAWETEFDWTISQHEIGAQFAAENCTKLQKNEDIYKNACSVLAKENPDKKNQSDSAK